MSRILRLMWAGLIALGGWAAPPPRTQATNLGTPADYVFGQPDFTSGGENTGGSPTVIAVQPVQHLERNHPPRLRLPRR